MLNHTARKMLKVASRENDADAPLGVVVKSTVIIAAKKMVKINAEKRIARNEPPAVEVRVRLSANAEIIRTFQFFGYQFQHAYHPFAPVVKCFIKACCFS